MTQLLLIFLIFISAPLCRGFVTCGVTEGRCDRTATRKAANNDPSMDSSSNSKGDVSHAQAKFLETTAREGASAVRHMSVEERTKRALLAEAAEDRMVKLTDDLDKLLDHDGLPRKVEYREEVIVIARQIKASQEQYRSLVNGEPSPLLDALDGQKEN